MRQRRLAALLAWVPRPHTGPWRAPGRVRRLAVPIALVSLVAACSDSPVDVPPEGAIDLALPWRTATPAGVGMDGGELFIAGELAGRIERMRSLLVVRNGRLAFERYYGGWGVDTLADVRSVTKSVVSTLTGIAIEQGFIEGPDQPITDFLRRPQFDVRPEHASVTVGHLLTMTSGFQWSESGSAGYNDWIVAPDHVAYLLDRPLDHQPGTTFAYNSAAVHLLGVVLEEATGLPLPAFADQFLFGPLGIGDARWEALTDGRFNGSSGLDLRPRDLARLGQLFLQGGWSGRRSVISSDWTEVATSILLGPYPSSGAVTSLGYGYLWWIDTERDAYLAWGFGGQFVYVVPALDLVVVADTDWRGVDQDIGSTRLAREVLGVIVERVVPAAR